MPVLRLPWSVLTGALSAEARAAGAGVSEGGSGIELDTGPASPFQSATPELRNVDGDALTNPPPVTGRSGTEARKGIRAWIGFYNAQRPHSALAGLTPDEAYAGAARARKLAA